MGGTNKMPDGPKPAEGNVSMQGIADMQSLVNLLGGATDPTAPDRILMANALGGTKTLSSGRFGENPTALTGLSDAYDTEVDSLRKPVKTFDLPELQAAYGIGARTAVTTFASQVAAAEMLIRAGGNVALAIDGGWDTHGDDNPSGNQARAMMTSRGIIPSLKTFITRMMGTGLYAGGRNVVVAMYGDFARSLPENNHASIMTATVIGKYVKRGSSGRINVSGDAMNLPVNLPGITGFYAYLSKVLKVPTPGEYGSFAHEERVIL
jgi:hypothetical protein